MLGAAIIVFREVLEAALIIGIIAAATRGMPRRSFWLLGGVGLGIVAAVLVALSAGRIADLADGVGQELFNAGVLAVAVAMLAWHNIWMSRHARALARDARQLGSDVADGERDMSAMALVVALAVLREGAETVLFLYGQVIGGADASWSVPIGALLGLGCGALAGYALYAGLLSIPVRWFFTATAGLILLLAAAMASQCARLLIQADLLPSLANPAWDTSWLLTNTSALGSLLHALLGYEASPSGMQVLFYAATLSLIAFGMRRVRTPTTH